MAKRLARVEANCLVGLVQGFFVPVALDQTIREERVRGRAVGRLRECLAKLAIGQVVTILVEEDDSALKGRAHPSFKCLRISS